MNLQKKLYRYMVECIKHGKWVPVCHTDFEDIGTFGLVTNVEEYQYRMRFDCSDAQQ